MTAEQIKAARELLELTFVTYRIGGELHRAGPAHWNDAVTMAPHVAAKSDGGAWQYDSVADAMPELAAALTDALDEVERLQTRQGELLATIVRVTRETPYPEESRNAATLIAQVGTLKARVRELELQLGTAEDVRG